MREKLAGFDFVKFVGAFGIHVPLINKFAGDWLARSFHHRPFFFLSHFLWSGESERRRPIKVFFHPPQPRRQTFTGMAGFDDAVLAPCRRQQGQACAVVSVHVRTDTNHPVLRELRRGHLRHFRLSLAVLPPLRAANMQPATHNS